jgi:hypothetical protein
VLLILSFSAVRMSKRFAGRWDSNRTFTRLKGYPPLLYTCSQWRQGQRTAIGVHHEHSHSSLDFVYGCCRLYVGNKHALNQ